MELNGQVHAPAILQHGERETQIFSFPALQLNCCNLNQQMHTVVSDLQ